MKGTSQQTWDRGLDDMEPAGSMEAGWAPFWAYGVMGALPALFLLVAMAKIAQASLKKRRAAAVERRSGKPLNAGDAVLKGTVRDVEGEGPAVRLQVEQIGVPEQRGDKTKKWFTVWTEVERTLDTRPFYIETASGERVRVEPSEETKLIDDLEEMGREDQSRFKAAELVEGEVIYAVGELGEGRDPARGGYRDASPALVLRSPARGHLLLSTHRLGVEHEQSRRLWAFSSVVVLIATLLAQLLAFNYHAAYFFGHTEAAKVIRREHIPAADSDDSDTYEVHYELVSTGRASSDLVEPEDYPKLTVGRIFPVRVVEVFGDPRITVGAGATIHGAVHFFPAIVLLLVMAFLAYMIRSSTPWFLRERLVDEEEGKQV